MRPRYWASAIAVLLILVAAGILLATRLLVSPSGEPAAREPSASASGSAYASPSPTSTSSPSPRATPTAKPSAAPKPSAIARGMANRTSIALVATYDVAATLHFGDRSLSAVSTMTVRNASGAPIDRVELNTVTARIG